MFALVVPQNNNTVAQLSSVPFEIAPPFFWVECGEDVSSGDTYENGSFVKPVVETNSLQVEARKKRNILLTASDWTQVLDAPVDRDAWAAYRQALRDIPQQAGFPTSIDWPVKP